jgi:hypothetical protein
MVASSGGQPDAPKVSETIGSVVVFFSVDTRRDELLGLYVDREQRLRRDGPRGLSAEGARRVALHHREVDAVERAAAQRGPRAEGQRYADGARIERKRSIREG